MIHNPEHRMAKMMREIRAFDPKSVLCPPGRFGLIRCPTYTIVVRHQGEVNAFYRAQSRKRERCVRQALKQVRKIRGKK